MLRCLEDGLSLWRSAVKMTVKTFGGMGRNWQRSAVGGQNELSASE